MDYLGMAQQLRATRQAEQQRNDQQVQSGGAAASGGGIVGQGNTMFQSGGYAPQTQQQQPQQNPLQTGLDAYDKYNKANNLFSGGAGSSLGATGTAYAGSGAAGTGYGLGGSLVAGTGLGSMLGSYSGGTAAGGSTAGGVGALGGTTSSAGLGSTFGAGSGGAAAGGGGTAAAGGTGALGAGGMLAGLAALGYLGDKEINQSDNSMISKDKLNSLSVDGIGLRFGDLVNGFNPATWIRSPKEGAKGLGNFFTLGFLDKIF